MLKILISLLLILTLFENVYAVQSTITESDGYACMGEDRTKRQTEEMALQDAKKKAIEQVSTYIQAETQVKDLELQKDIVNAFAKAIVKILSASGKWDNDPPKVGDCYKVKIKAEVIPDELGMKKIIETKDFDDPTLPLKVMVWTEKREFKSGEKIKIYFRGNKPFFARIIYKQADGNLVQILPNPYREDNYFQGGTVYEIPSGPDKFELEVAPPFGEEDIILYASTSQLGNLDLEKAESVYLVKSKDMGIKTRGIKIVGKSNQKLNDFFEENIKIHTKK